MQKILESVQDGSLAIHEAKKLLALYSVEQVEGFAKIDINRGSRRAIPEIVFAESKELTETKKIAKRILSKSDSVLVSRLPKDHYPKVLSYAKSLGAKAKTGKKCSAILLYKRQARPSGGRVGILTAGTSDIGVAEESRLVCEAMGCSCITSYDVGVAGIQRVFPAIKEMISRDVGCVIVAAGMEGALATLVSTLVDIPVIGVPTSVGYGYGRDGIAALASMLQSCSLGLSVVNIDNGIAAGGIAANIANRVAQKGGGGPKRARRSRK